MYATLSSRCEGVCPVRTFFGLGRGGDIQMQASAFDNRLSLIIKVKKLKF